MRDLIEFDSYDRIKIPVGQGDIKGEVRSFINNKRNNSQIKIYVGGLQDLINEQKWLDSVIANGDIGPARAIANSMEYGHHQRFLEQIVEKSGLTLRGVEKTLEVQEGNNIYHILPKDRDSLNDFKCIEQRGLVIFHLYNKFQESGNYDKQEAYRWLTGNCGRFRKMLEGCEPKEGEELFGYSNCNIFKNLCKRTFEEFKMNIELIDKVDTRGAFAAYANAERRFAAVVA
ncbi:MAG: hypothetical protein KKE23_00455 [Nanoarchaeota archaeon]|nr:hypothetical protein [Nanoarchaeota archaeon]